MRKLVLLTAAVAVTLSFIVPAAPANAQNSQSWCMRHAGHVSCMYASHAQCRASASGRGGTCFRRQR
jgi:hypothetical protein